MKGISENLFRLQTLDSAAKNPDAGQAADLRASIPQGMLANYDRARARGKKGIARVHNNVCTNCRIQVPVAVAASLMRGMVQVCGNCGIYLYLEASEPVALPEKVSTPPVERKRRSPRAKAAA
jgi:predicted  nucleic acid-binding Zn-ribbon protein